jgi:hypothetical protein
MYNIYPHVLFLNFSYKILESQFFFKNVSRLTRVNLCNLGPGLLAGSTPMPGLIIIVAMKI